MSEASIITIADANWYQEVVTSDRLVLVYFWAPWCEPCRMMTPVIDQLANDYAGKVRIGKLNVDENLVVTHQYAYTPPATLLFKNGQVVAAMSGATNKAALQNLINPHITGAVHAA